MSDYFIGGKLSDLDPGKLNLQDASALRQTEILADMLSEQRKTNFLLELISGVDIDVETFK